MSIEVDITDGFAVFRDGSVLAGEYVLNDAFKPYFRTVNTPAGHNLTLVSPGDHRHHKGLMYALVAEDVCWWEEDPGTGHCGVQAILNTEAIDSGIRQEILWREEGGGMHTYREHREITLQRDGANAFNWTWKTCRESLRPHHLKKSRWSLEIPSGRKINYHGLGIRLPYGWAFGPDVNPLNGIEMEGKPIAPMDASGKTGSSVTWWGVVDGYWSPPKCAVTITQAQDFAWFVLKRNFPYLAVGPTCTSELDVSLGEVFAETYTVRVEDRT